MKDKQIAMEAIGKFPENASLNELAEESLILAAIQKGKTDVSAGRVKSHAQVEGLFATWIPK